LKEGNVVLFVQMNRHVQMKDWTSQVDRGNAHVRDVQVSPLWVQSELVYIRL
jgi:hypothetical protein